MTAYLKKGGLITLLISTATGLLSSCIVVGSENGYVGGYSFVAVLILMLPACLVLLAGSLIGLALRDRFAVFVLLFALMVPSSFFLFLMSAKYFSIGAYREEPMIPVVSTE